MNITTIKRDNHDDLTSSIWRQFIWSQTYKPGIGNSPISVKRSRIIIYPATLARTQYVSGINSVHKECPLKDNWSISNAVISPDKYNRLHWATTQLCIMGDWTLLCRSERCLHGMLSFFKQYALHWTVWVVSHWLWFRKLHGRFPKTFWPLFFEWQPHFSSMTCSKK